MDESRSKVTRHAGIRLKLNQQN
uniref:Uncharacterized protein n=1 Tax=Arundo donax TaxID=35708 RepID=A0A0A9ARH0_ARUDO